MRVAHVITGLEIGGAEVMLHKLLATMDRADFEPMVVSLVSPGPMGERIAALGIRVETLGMRRGVPSPGALVRLVRLLRRFRPDLVQTWMYHADLLGALARPFLGSAALVWNIRQSDLDPRLSRGGTRAVARVNAWLSHRAPDHILCCSERARRVHSGLGYRSDIMTTIPNGFDLGRFHPDPQARAQLRRELAVALDAPLLGLVARFDPQKDLETFLKSVARVGRSRPDARFLICGQGMDAENAALAGWIRESALGERLHLLGPRIDTPRVFAALDLLVSSSAYGEGFPNVVGEAMASGCPCVVTDVGDSALIVGHTGLAVPPRDPERLASALLGVLGEGHEGLARRGRLARARVESHYALPGIAARYGELYQSLDRGMR